MQTVVSTNLRLRLSTHLHTDMAAAAGHVDIVKKLLEYHANVNIQNNQGNTPLHQATWRKHSVRFNAYSLT
jgi:ankyrin repeat protein